MAKRYHESKRHSEHHSKLPTGKSNAVLSEDHGSVANMPKGVEYHEWAASPMYTQQHPNDNIEGVDEQIAHSISRVASHSSPRKA